MSANVAIVDYGSGNLLSVQRALEHVGATVSLVATPEGVASADRLLLPGVGAFSEGMAGLRRSELVEPLQEFARSGKPVLGICLGMQMLATGSEEFGVHPGLDIVPGRVVAIQDTALDGSALKRPHIGWADICAAPWRTPSELADHGMEAGRAVYLVHSYRFEPEKEEDLLAWCLYGGHRIAAAVSSGNVVGYQFHPEKSGQVGLRMLDAFLKR